LDTPWSGGRGEKAGEGEGGGKGEEGGCEEREERAGVREEGWVHRGEEGKRRGEESCYKNREHGYWYIILTFGTTYILLDMTSTPGVCTPSFTSSSLSTITRVFLWVARCFSPTGFGYERP